MNQSKTVRRFDFGEITNVERTPQGFLKVPGFATRIGVFPYQDGTGQVRRELRHPDDVFAPESLVTLKNAPVTNEHPPEMVTPENYDTYAVGYTTDRVEVNRDLVETDLIIAEADAIKAVEDGGKRELSSGYLADLIEEEGSYNGVQYNYRQKNIRYNHVALVDRGRAGPEVRLRMDSADAEMVSLEQPLTKMVHMKDDEKNKVIISGEEVEMPAHLAAVVRDMLDRYDEMRAKLAKLEGSMKKDDMAKKDVDISQKGVSSKVHEEQKAPDGREVAGKVGPSDLGGAMKAKGLDDDDKCDEDKHDDNEGGAAMAPAEMLKNELEHLKEQLAAAMAKHDEMQAKIDEMSSQSEGKKQMPAAEGKMDSLSTRVRKRVKLEREAEKLVPAELCVKFDSMSDDEIRMAVIKHRHPKADLAGKSGVYLQSRFDSIVETVSESETTRREYGRHMLGERMDTAELDPVDARRKMIESTRQLWTNSLSATRK